MLVSPRAADRRSDWHQKSLVSICIYTYLNVRYMLMNNEVDTNSCHSTFSSSTLPSTNTAGFFSCFFCSRVVSKLSAAYLCNNVREDWQGRSCGEHLLSSSFVNSTPSLLSPSAPSDSPLWTEYCKTQQFTDQKLSSSIFACCSFVRPDR